MNKELIQKQKKFLGLFFGMWALFLVNMFILYFFLVDELRIDKESMPLPLSLITIFQMWAIYKYILKK